MQEQNLTITKKTLRELKNNKFTLVLSSTSLTMFEFRGYKKTIFISPKDASPLINLPDEILVPIFKFFEKKMLQI